MSAQTFTQGAIVFLLSATLMNMLISFIQLWVEERQKCSIMVKEEKNNKASLFAGKKTKEYAVLRMAEKTA